MRAIVIESNLTIRLCRRAARAAQRLRYAANQSDGHSQY